MSIFGWDYPAGCSGPPDDGQGSHCDVCCAYVDDCVCPECPTCGTQGNPECYQDHGMKHNNAQLRARSLARIEVLRDQIDDEQMFLAELDRQDT